MTSSWRQNRVKNIFASVEVSIKLPTINNNYMKIRLPINEESTVSKPIIKSKRSFDWHNENILDFYTCYYSRIIFEM